jgi:hypothetical protein
MISEIIVYAVTRVVQFFTSFLPGAGQVPLKLPWGIDDIVVSGVQGYKVLAQSFPPFQTILTAFTIYISFRIILRLMRAIPFVGNTLD